MNYSKKTWDSEETKFFPKRKVDNKLSWKFHHLIGSFYSNKMQRTVEYESLGECMFYFLLELDQLVIRYYVQPVEVDFSYLNKEGDPKKWSHVPDVLVFRNGYYPFLYQIKETESSTQKHQMINNGCINYAEQRSWEYKVIYPKELPKTILKNIQSLQGAIKLRKGFNLWIPEVLKRLGYFKSSTIIELAKSFTTEVNPLIIIPIIYHLIAQGLITTNLYKEIDEYSEIRVGSIMKQLTNFIFEEGEIIEI